MEKTFKWVAWIFAVGLSLQSIYTSYFGLWEPRVHRSLAVMFCAIIVTFVYPLARIYQPQRKMIIAICWLVDFILVAIVIYAVWRFITLIEDVENLIAEFSLIDQLVAMSAILVLLEMTRRAFGIALSLVAALSLAYCLFGADLPWFFRHSGFSLEQTMEIIWYGFQGVFGLPTGIVLGLILIFIVFGAVLEGTGAGDSLIRIALSLTGRSRGGPAHAAVGASALFGTMSGSVTANVVGTGVMTIPMIKQRGFTSNFAGAVEAAASSGGQIMPPVMGAAAFLMADLIGMPYIKICAAALLPALFYYASLSISVSLEAKRLGIEPIPVEERQKLDIRDLINSAMFVGPILVIIFTLVMGRSPAMAGGLATMSAIVLGFLINKDLRKKPQRMLTALAKGGVAGSTIMMAVGAIGVLLAAFDLTGIGLKFANVISNIGGTNLFFGLVVTALACLMLGMGMPTFPAYLIIVLVLGPAIKMLGVPALAIHLFVFYFGVLSAITPPVALAAFAAAPIAQSDPIKTGFRAIGIALAGFIIPFVFVYENSLLLVLDFDIGSFIWVSARLMFAIWLLATAITGFESVKLPAWNRLLRMAAAVTVLIAFTYFQVAGIVVGCLVIWSTRLAGRKILA
jgi:TRAP transporter 4TM/12TM fusion protein